MDIKHRAILEANGWEIECEGPFEIRNSNTESFASNQAAYIVLESLIPKVVDPRKIIPFLEYDEDNYIDKLNILVSLIKEPNVRHVIHKDIDKWCIAQGFDVKYIYQAKSSWVECGLE